MKQTLKEIWEYLKGKKTYLATVLSGLITMAIIFGKVDWTPEQTVAVEGFLTALIGSTVAHRITHSK